MSSNEYSYLYEHQMRLADLQDIAAMDRLAAELTPQSALSRWAQQRRASQGVRSESRGIRRLLGLGRPHQV